MSPQPGQSRRSRLLLGIAGVTTRRSRLVVGIWITLVGVLAFVGRDLEHELINHPFFVSGSPSQRAHEIALKEFGSDNAMVVMLRGPHAQVERQGRQLAGRLEARPRMLVVAPWSGGGSIDGLSPSPEVVTLIVRVEASEAEGDLVILPPVQRAVDARVREPVHASIAGLPVIIEFAAEVERSAAKLGEMIAVPALLLVLLLVFRSVLAAVMPILVGGAVVVATRGLLAVLHGLSDRPLCGQRGRDDGLGPRRRLLAAGRLAFSRGAAQRRR